MAEIRRPGIESTAHVSDRVLPFWLEHGWELVDDPKDTGLVLVFARSMNDAKTTARAQGLTAKQWRYIASPADLEHVGGDRGRPVLVSENFTEHPEHGAIHAAAAAVGLQMSPTDPVGD